MSKLAVARKPFTGRHMALILVTFFGVVIAVNILMARFAISTFGGVVVENSYVASQEFNKWLDEAAAEKKLGWTATASRLTDGRIEVRMAGLPHAPATMIAEARHPLGTLPDRTLAFAETAPGRFVSDAPLPTGRWRLRLEAMAGGHHWRDEIDSQ
jgi:nitrogen fixation protein FixH